MILILIFDFQCHLIWNHFHASRRGPVQWIFTYYHQTHLLCRTFCLQVDNISKRFHNKKKNVLKWKLISSVEIVLIVQPQQFSRSSGSVSRPGFFKMGGFDHDTRLRCTGKTLINELAMCLTQHSLPPLVDTNTS